MSSSRKRTSSPTNSSSNHKDWKLDCKVYVGDLGYGAAKQELEDAFQKHGQLKNVWIARRPPGFAFVEYMDPLDAEDAAHALDGTRINGRKVRVEMSSGKSRWGSNGPPKRGSSYNGPSGSDRSDRSRRGRSRSYSPVRSRRSRSRSDTPPRRRSRSRSYSEERSPRRRD